MEKVFYKGLNKQSSEPEFNKGDEIKICLYSVSKEDGENQNLF